MRITHGFSDHERRTSDSDVRYGSPLAELRTQVQLTAHDTVS
jgi:hypothetical protein